MDEAPRYRLDDLRRLGATLAVALGVAPARAAAWMGLVLWYDAAGAHDLGVATLPAELERIALREVDPAVEPVVGHEYPSTARVDARGGCLLPAPRKHPPRARRGR